MNENLIHTLPSYYAPYFNTMNYPLSLLKSIQLGQLEQFFASTLRLQKCCDPASLPLTLANQSRYLSLNNVAFKDAVDSQNEKSSTGKKVRWNKGYSVADDNLIAKQIELYGRNTATCKKLAKEIGLNENSCWAILLRHKFHIANQPTVNGDFSPQEDQTILDYVNKNGRSTKTIEELTLLLGRGSPKSVSGRLKILSSETETTQDRGERKQWTLEDNTIMVKFFVRNVIYKDSNELPEKLKTSDIENFAIKMHRSTSAVYHHWMNPVFPVLKTHTMGLPLEENWLWQKRLMMHIIEGKIEKSSDINFYELLAEEINGQSYSSLSRMVRQFRYKTQSSVKVLSNDVLWKRVEKSYLDKSPQMLCFSKKRQAKQLELIHNIIEAYESSKI